VGAIPIAYAISLGGLQGLPLDARQTEELLLTSAQSLLAAIMLSDLTFSRREALTLAALFTGQLFFSSTEARWWFTGFYGFAAVALLIRGPKAQRDAFFALLLPRWNRGAGSA
jgi:cation:H+ antiporter